MALGGRRGRVPRRRSSPRPPDSPPREGSAGPCRESTRRPRRRGSDLRRGRSRAASARTMHRTACRNLGARTALTSVRTRRERVPLSDAGQPLRSLRLEGGDVALLTKRDRDLVESFKKTRPRKLVEREGRPNARRLNGRALDGDREGHAWVTARRVDERLDRIRA